MWGQVAADVPAPSCPLPLPSYAPPWRGGKDSSPRLPGAWQSSGCRGSSRQPGDGEIISEPFPPPPPPLPLQDHTGCPRGAQSTEPAAGAGQLAGSLPAGTPQTLTSHRGRVLVKSPARCPGAVPRLLERDAEWPYLRFQEEAGEERLETNSARNCRVWNFSFCLLHPHHEPFFPGHRDMGSPCPAENQLEKGSLRQEGELNLGEEVRVCCRAGGLQDTANSLVQSAVLNEYLSWALDGDLCADCFRGAVDRKVGFVQGMQTGQRCFFLGGGGVLERAPGWETESWVGFGFAV